jgi:hypothetical protein
MDSRHYDVKENGIHLRDGAEVKRVTVVEIHSENEE